MQNFPISGWRLDPAVIHALGRIKQAAAAVNTELGIVEPAIGQVIAEAAGEVAAGRWDAEFPIDVFQTGSGTSSNMNANEVIAHLAAERAGRGVHPNDDVNASQSSNDVFPSAVHLAAVHGFERDLIPALQHLSGALRAKETEFAEVVKAGRTHLMDATPVTLGQEFGGYAAAVENGVERARGVLPRLGELAIGGTAVGTGINAPPGFAAAVVARLRDETGLPVSEARNHFEAQSTRDGLVEASAALRTIAVSLFKIANDLRWMASGPRTGLAEIRLPDLQPGSSIMPGKVNPVLAEALCQVVAQVIGSDAAVAFAGTTGAFELNVAVPVMAHNLLSSVRILSAACRLFADRCVAGIQADVERCRRHAEASPAVATGLNRRLGYETAAAVVKQAVAENKTLLEVVLDQNLMTEAEARRLLDVESLTRGGIPEDAGGPGRSPGES